MNEGTLQQGSMRLLVFGLALVMLMVLPYLTPWVGAFVALLLLWRLLLDNYRWALPRVWLLLPLTLLAGLGIMLSYRGLFGRDASAALLCVMLALKLMEAKSTRDIMLLIFAGFFVTITAFLFNQSLLVGLYLLLPVFVLTLTLLVTSLPQTQSSDQSARKQWQAQGRLAGQLLLQSLPIMLVLFVLFPRIPGPLWGVPEDSYKNMTGLSEQMSPGNISQLTRSYATAFRVDFKADIPKPQQLYWRGPVLWHFDGRTWRMRQDFPAQGGHESLQVRGAEVEYAVTLEPHNRRWLLLLDMPNRLPEEAMVTYDMQVKSSEPVRLRKRYTAHSNLDYTLGASLSEHDRMLATQLPDDENPRSFALAAGWRQQGLAPEQIVEAALQMFRSEAFFYTLRPPILRQHPIDSFLFQTRSGFCEHYASSFVFLMRAAGIPARVVSGYQGGEINPVNHSLIVRQSDAHAWAEVWLQERGWVRVDPTAAVSPLRVESGIDAALPENADLPLLARNDYPLLRKLYLNWDAVNHHWNQMVLGYDQQKQMDVLRRLLGDTLAWQDLVILMMLALLIVALALGFWLMRGSYQARDPMQKLYQRFLRKLAVHGIRPAIGEGPQDFYLRAAIALPKQAAWIKIFGQNYVRLRYARGDDSELLQRQLRQALKKI